MVSKSGARRPPEMKRLREVAGLSQAQLAERASTTQAMVSKFETGENEPKGLRTALALAAALGVDVVDIWPHLAPKAPQPAPQHRRQRASTAVTAGTQRAAKNQRKRKA